MSPSRAQSVPLAVAVVVQAALVAWAAGQDAAVRTELGPRPAVPAGQRAIQAGGYVDLLGKIVPAGLLIVSDGTIVQVGGEVPTDMPVDAYPGAVLCPGLVDCLTALGVHGELSERQTAVQPRINTRDAFNRYAPPLRAALAAGVTTFALVPDDQNLVGGQIAVFQTSGPDGHPVVLSDEGPLKLSLSPATFKVDREPTSRMGALGLLRETLDAARTPTGTGPLSELARGERLGLMTVPTAADVLAAVNCVDAYGLRLAIIHTQDARHVARLAAGKVAGVIVGPLDWSAGVRDATAAGLFERGGVPVAIAGGLPHAPTDGLRIGAAVAARNGLSVEAARRAITMVPAELLGVADRVGSLQVQRRADVVVFSGDPLDLRSRVLAVYVAGRRVFTAPEGTP